MERYRGSIIRHCASVKTSSMAALKCPARSPGSAVALLASSITSAALSAPMISANVRPSLLSFSTIFPHTRLEAQPGRSLVRPGGAPFPSPFPKERGACADAHTPPFHDWTVLARRVVGRSGQLVGEVIIAPALHPFDYVDGDWLGLFRCHNL
jgi:hypothetical protein